ncbi:hypothetical protein DPMN_155145 [Dreissena polymorpha]|uniref:Uncharacterized protein n=1 Tax=Dreissena polymorpha TaxID=45954 RepID=A0A9D4FQN3_DREPO|nr:hypothetical protein DPMN_155145 [Dreissena polymorpha]
MVSHSPGRMIISCPVLSQSVSPGLKISQLLGKVVIINANSQSPSLTEVTQSNVAKNNIAEFYIAKSNISQPSNGQSVTQSYIAQSNSQSPSLISPSLMVSQSLSLIAFTQSNFQSSVTQSNSLAPSLIVITLSNGQPSVVKRTLIHLLIKFGEDRMKTI